MEIVFPAWASGSLFSSINKISNIVKILSCPTDQPEKASLKTSSIVSWNSFAVEKDDDVGIPVSPPTGTVNISPLQIHIQYF